MDMETESLGSAVILKPLGRVDQTSAQAFQDGLIAALDAGQKAIAIDMSQVDFLSSIGLRALMVAHKKSQSTGAKLALFGLTPMVREVFSISRFDTVLRCFDVRDTALASFEK